MVGIGIFLLIVALGFFLLQVALEAGAPGGVSITVGLLFALPFSLGALVVFLADPLGRHLDKSYSMLTAVVILGVLVVGGFFLREGIICMVIIAPLWVPSGLFGALVMKKFQRYHRDHRILRSSGLAMLPLVFGLIQADIFVETDHYAVSRSVVVAAPVEKVWPLLLLLEDIQADEGQWNISQNVFEIPRPASALLQGDGIGAIRHATWAGDVSFEEHIIAFEAASHIRWNFVFPNDSVQHRTDKHISPDGKHLTIKEGGYRLVPISENETRIVLDTQYSATTPVNLYSAFWGELFLGDIQSNILTIIKQRAEKPV